ncbi:MAG: ThuA domain-containing protein [Calditrichaeota bacterium]|nr:MAG: ThuA domain-containing protein [Calditrichota bacterium]
MKIIRQLLMISLIGGPMALQAQTNRQFDILVYAAPDFYHSVCIPTAISSLEKLAERYQFGFSWTQEKARFAEPELFRYAAVVFLNSTGDDFTEDERQNLQKFIHEGRGFVGIHAASATQKKWPWYDQLIGRVFIEHPEVQFGVLQVITKHFPATMHMSERWLWSDEWYTFEMVPVNKNLIDLLTVDEKTYDPTKDWGRGKMKGMGDFHPISWYQEFEGGRSFYTALGHMPELYADDVFMSHLLGGIYWAATGKGVLQ